MGKNGKMNLAQFFSELFGYDKKTEVLTKENYGRVEIDFTEPKNQGDNISISLQGKFLSKISYTGNEGDASLRINHPHASQLPVTEIKSLKSIGGFNKVYLTSTDTHGKLILLISTGIISEIKPTIDNEVTESRRAMKTDVLVVDETNEVDTLQCPTGKRLEILGFNAVFTQKTPTTVSSSILCYTLDEDGDYQTLFRYNPIVGAGDNAVHVINMSGIVFRGGLNKGIALNHMIFTGGAMEVAVTLYYRSV